MPIPFLSDQQTIYEDTYTHPLRKYAVEFIDGETRTYIANTHEFDGGFLILKEVPDSFTWQREWNNAKPKGEWDVVKRLSCVRDVRDEEIGYDEFVVVYDTEQGTSLTYDDPVGIVDIDHTRVVE